MVYVKAFQLALSLCSANTFILPRVMASTSAIGQQLMKAVSHPDSSTENMTLVDAARPVVKEGQALLKVHSSAINRADTLQRKGFYPPPKGESEILGLEAAGEICEVHKSCAGAWNVGDKVMALCPGGGNAEYVSVDCRHMMPVPKSLTMLEAGGVPEVWLTAYQLLHFVGHLKSSDSVLIHAGASGVGTAAVQLVKLYGAHAYTTAGTDDKVKFTVSLGATKGFNYKTGDWRKELLNATDGRGVDLILDCVGGSYWEQNTDVLAMDGRWVLYGLMGGANVDGPILRKLLSKRISLLPTTLRSRSNQYKADLVDSFAKNALPHFDDMKLKPIIETVFELKDIGKAHALMESNKSAGKILLKVFNPEKPRSEL